MGKQALHKCEADIDTHITVTAASEKPVQLATVADNRSHRKGIASVKGEGKEAKANIVIKTNLSAYTVTNHKYQQQTNIFVHHSWWQQANCSIDYLSACHSAFVRYLLCVAIPLQTLFTCMFTVCVCMWK